MEWYLLYVRFDMRAADRRVMIRTEADGSRMDDLNRLIFETEIRHFQPAP